MKFLLVIVFSRKLPAMKSLSACCELISVLIRDGKIVQIRDQKNEGEFVSRIPSKQQSNQGLRVQCRNTGIFNCPVELQQSALTQVLLWSNK
jgi:hypothetical protein